MSKKKNFYLIALLVMAFLVNFYPHSGYDYPVHVDEWENFARARSVSESESTIYRDIRTGEKIENDLEILMGVMLSSLHELGADWLVIFRFFPAFLATLNVLLVYILTRKYGFGFEAGIFTALIPTTIRLLGPGFLVAVSVGLIFIPLSLFMVFNKKQYSIPVFIFSLFLLFLHPPTAMALFVILGIYATLNLKSNHSESLKIFSVMILSFLIYIPYLLPRIIPLGAKAITFEGGVPIKSLIEYIGTVPVAFFIIGTYFISSKKDKKNLTILFSTITFFLLLVIFRYFGQTILIMPARIHMYLMLFMGLVGGYGLSRLKKIKLLYIVLALVIILTGLQNITSQQYYQIIDESDYEAFRWVEQNTPKNSTAAMDPWKAVAFPSISGRSFYSYVPRGSNEFYMERNQKVNKFLSDKCKNTSFMIENEISVVYSPSGCSNRGLKNPYDRVYILND